MSHKRLNRFTSTAPSTIYKTRAKKFTDQDPGTTQPEGNSIHLNYKIIIFIIPKIFPVLMVNSLCKNIFLIFFSKFPVFSLSGKMDFQIPCFPGFPCAVATLTVHMVRKVRYSRIIKVIKFAKTLLDQVFPLDHFTHFH